MKELKLKELEKSFESGLLTEEEYEKNKKEIEEMPEQKIEEKKEEEKEVKLKSDKMLIGGVIVLIIIFGAIIGIKYFNQDQPRTIDELHDLNLRGKLKADQGYLYKDIQSFVKVEDVWYVQLMSQSGRILYNFNFRYSPRELEDIKINGNLDLDKFNKVKAYFVTFNPLGKELSHIRLARLDYDIMMTRIFKKDPISACDRNETSACLNIPIITCDNTKEIVVYYKESEELSVEFDDNCIIISGSGLDLVKGVDRVLYNFYGIMDQ